MLHKRQYKSFTLVEIVVVLSIIVILASILIAAINPNAILKRSRDVTRLQDLDTIDKAIQVMKIEISNFDELNYASQNIVYISLKDSSSTCGSYINQLPSLPSGWQYRCSNSPTNIDGTGWIPFPFNQVPLLTLSKLPVDPINKPPYYYAFIVGGSFSLFTMLEDPQRTPNSKNDGDNFPHLYSTVNSNKNLINQAQGLVGYWSFDEGSGNIARDYSGNGNNGTLYNFNFTATSGWVDGKVGKALSFDGVDDYVEV
jgi:type II secretory pathway pseudopilin PulG